MDKPLVRYSTEARVARLTLDHPEKRNALSRRMLETLRGALERAAEDPAVKVIVLFAEGPVFSSGHDLRELRDPSHEAAQVLFDVCTDVMQTIRRVPQPVVAGVQGLATAAGCQLVATCDLVVASEQAAFAAPGVKIGLFCSTPAVPLCRAVPAKKALEMLFTGDALSAAEAERCGLVNRVVAPDRVVPETLALAEKIAAASAATLALGKRAFYEQLGRDIGAAYVTAQARMLENLDLPDAKEGIAAFLDKRPPQWER